MSTNLSSFFLYNTEKHTFKEYLGAVSHNLQKYTIIGSSVSHFNSENNTIFSKALQFSCVALIYIALFPISIAWDIGTSVSCLASGAKRLEHLDQQQKLDEEAVKLDAQIKRANRNHAICLFAFSAIILGVVGNSIYQNYMPLSA